MNVERVSRILGKDAKHMTTNSIIEELMKIIELDLRKKENLWRLYEGKSLVSRRTFYRRVEEMGWTAEKAASVPPAPTRK